MNPAMKKQHTFNPFLLFGIPCISVLITLFSPNIGRAEAEAFCTPQLLAHPIQGGYTWTVASRLGKFLELAEDEYGERDKSWTILGVEFSDEMQPSNWYPFFPERKNIIIQLSKNAANDKKRALFQLAHETFHVLSPNGTRAANYLEEGLATYFSIKATQEAGEAISPDYIASKHYREAYDLILRLYHAYPDASQRIATFRKRGKPLSTLTQAGISEMFPNIEPSLASKLAERF